jgi:tryptophanyl-tRNA synthetase
MMITDPARMRRADPGNPDVCNVFAFHGLYKTPDVLAAQPDLLPLAEVDRRCRSAELGCVDDKKQLAREINLFLDRTVRPRRAELEKDPARVDAILEAGAEPAAGRRRTMDRVHGPCGWRDPSEGRLPRPRDACTKGRGNAMIGSRCR